MRAIFPPLILIYSGCRILSRSMFLLIFGLCISCSPGSRNLSHRQTATQQKSIEHIWSFTLSYYDSANKAIPFKGTVSTIRPWEKKRERERDIICNVKLQCCLSLPPTSLLLSLSYSPSIIIAASRPIQIEISNGNKAITISPSWRMKTINKVSFPLRRCRQDRADT